MIKILENGEYQMAYQVHNTFRQYPDVRLVQNIIYNTRFVLHAGM